jgi:uncharacterized protein
MNNETYIERLLNPFELVSHKSCLLLGPRQTGKSQLIAQTMKGQCTYYNLLETDLYFRMKSDPSTLRKELLARSTPDKIVVIDEIQKVPELMNEVHNLIETQNLRFLLTGSSARALRKKGVNLLGGRARTATMRPFSYIELGDSFFDLLKALNRGLLPSLYFSSQARRDQQAYVGTYLKEEIAAEALTRNIPAFSRFLNVAGAYNGSILSPTNISNQSGVPKSTVVEYFQILKDTLLAEELPAWKKSKVRKPIESAKFYFFDVGIARCLAEKTPVKEKSADFGDALEHFVHHELRTFIDVARPGSPLHYWRSTSGFEVDFILGEETAIEVKSSSRPGAADLKGLRALKEENILKRYILVCNCETPKREDDGILILPIVEFLKRLWAGDFLEKCEEI